jgi:lipopolysaccharide/colanic/teichoic acid biosynthesis glycosyltransferase
MRAIVMAAGENAGFRLFADRWPLGLLPLCGQPILQHLVEVLVQTGVSDFDFVLRHLPEKVESYLGDGSRWGSRFRYHLASNARPAHQHLQAIVRPGDGKFLLVCEHTIPRLQPGWIEHAPTPAVLVDPHGVWTGWAVAGAELTSQISGASDAAEFEARLLEAARTSGGVSVVECPVSFATAEDFLRSQDQVLSGRGPSGSLLKCREAAPGIRIGRNVSLHPSTLVKAPLSIGANCRIGPGTRLGPNVVIGDNCILEGHARLSHTVVFEGSYIGELLELDHAVVDRSRLANVRLDTEVSVTDAFLLARLTGLGFQSWLARIASRALAIGLLALLAPVLLFVAAWLKLFRRGPVLHYREVVKLPAEDDPGQWRTFRLPAFVPRAAGSFVLEVLPGLVSVASGHLALVGLAPRNAKEILELPADWRNLYLHSKAGLITEATVNGVDADDTDGLYSAEAYYAAVAGFSYDLRLLGKYIGRWMTRRRQTEKNSKLKLEFVERTGSESSAERASDF